MTISLWTTEFIPSDGDRPLVAGLDSSGSSGLDLRFTGAEDRLAWTTNGDSVELSQHDLTTEGLWNHWVLVKDITTGTMRIYANGSEVSMAENTSGGIPDITQLLVGPKASQVVEYVGVMDEFRLYVRSLTPNEVQTLL